MKKKKKWNLFLSAGIALLGAALILTGYNLWEQERAGEDSARILWELKEQSNAEGKKETGQEEEAENGADTPAYIQNPQMEMPVILVEDKAYIGVLTIPELALELPVLSEWSYPNLRAAPCRYAGSAYEGNFVLAAHNYQTHFGRLDELSSGTEIFFTDMEGNVFRYRVAELEILQPTAVEEMIDEKWDLSLFTCTYGGQSRLTVRCEGGGYDR